MTTFVIDQTKNTNEEFKTVVLFTKIVERACRLDSKTILKPIRNVKEEWIPLNVNVINNK